jgi:hypothetical protein
VPRYRIELITKESHRAAIAEEQVGEEVQIEDSLEGEDGHNLVAYGGSGEVIGFIPSGHALHRRMNDPDDVDTEDIYALVQSIDADTLQVVLDVRTGTQADTARNRGYLERQKAREERRAAQPGAAAIARAAPPVARPLLPGQQPPGWQASPYAKPPPNSFQSCMTFVGWAVVIVIGGLMLLAGGFN